MLVATGAHPRVLPDAAARRRAHPHLGAALRPGRPARAPGGGRLRGDRGRVRLGLHRARLRRSPWCPAATGCCPGRTPTPRRCSRTCSRRRGMTVLSTVPGGRRYAGRATGVVVVPRRRPHGRGQPLPDGRRLDPEHRRPRAGGGRRRARQRRATSRSTGSRGPRRPGVYAAGDCTGVLMLASVAAMQGRIAMWHPLGDAVAPLNLRAGVVERVHRPRDRHRRLDRRTTRTTPAAP